MPQGHTRREAGPQHHGSCRGPGIEQENWTAEAACAIPGAGSCGRMQLPERDRCRSRIRWQGLARPPAHASWDLPRGSHEPIVQADAHWRHCSHRSRRCVVRDLDPAVASCWWSSGTSMAAPHGAGVAAIIVGRNGGAMHPAQVEAALTARVGCMQRRPCNSRDHRSATGPLHAGRPRCLDLRVMHGDFLARQCGATRSFCSTL
jgi:hypothetical protein